MRRSGWYNLTVAGAAGGRGLCNFYYGRGAVLKVTAYLTAGQDAAILVGQKGTGPCDVDPSHEPCQKVPINVTESVSCIFNNLLMPFGGGGGEASLVVLLNETKLVGLPLVMSGGGGGSGPVALFYDIDQNSNNINGSLPNMSFGSGRNGEDIGCATLDHIACLFRPGVGSGWKGNSSSLKSVDGQGFIMGDDFAVGGLPCCASFETHGGFGGGGGGCIEGGGGGGYTGGSVFIEALDGEGGTSFVANSFSGKEVILRHFYTNNDTGFVEIVPEDCGCTGSCVMYESDQFECVCPENSMLAPDQSDCYNGMFCSVVTDLDIFFYSDFHSIQYEHFITS